ncbi:MAG TPA: transglycosylase SLT domain-containing protein [Bradyrhizobium sp.]|nr:transglycosylase SLT domain-containing protein [Bradyrhizobium sp.]
MSMLPINRTVHGAGARWRLALAVACLLLPLGGKVAAQPDGAGDTGAVASSDDTTDSDAPTPLALEPFVPRALTSADLPPANPLVGLNFPRMSAAFGRDWRAARSEYRAIVERESLAFGLPPALVDAVMAVESRYNPAVIGLDGEIGLMQLMPATARMLGFTGTSAELAAPEVNVHYGAKYLAGAWRLSGGDLCTATMKYRAGHGETRFSFLSVDYCMRVRQHLAANGVAVSGSVPQPTFGSSRGGGAPVRGRSLSGGGTINFAGLNARLRELTDRGTPHNPH